MNNFVHYDGIEITKLLLFGTADVPEDFNERVREVDADIPTITYNADEFLDIGGGRYAWVARANLVEFFFTQYPDLPKGRSYTISELIFELTTNHGYTASGRNDLSIPLNQYATAPATDDYAERAYIFGSGGATLESATFNIDESGVRTISDIVVQPNNDGFDFNTVSDSIQFINDYYLSPTIDPYGLEQAEVVINFTDASIRTFPTAGGDTATYTLNKYEFDKLSQSDLVLSNFAGLALGALVPNGASGYIDNYLQSDPILKYEEEGFSGEVKDVSYLSSAADTQLITANSDDAILVGNKLENTFFLYDFERVEVYASDGDDRITLSRIGEYYIDGYNGYDRVYYNSDTWISSSGGGSGLTVNIENNQVTVSAGSSPSVQDQLFRIEEVSLSGFDDVVRLTGSLSSIINAHSDGSGITRIDVQDSVAEEVGDTLILNNSHGVDVNLKALSINDNSGTIVITGFDNVIGTDFSDTIIGDDPSMGTSGEVLIGGDGEDAIDGRGGDDILLGGDREDIIEGGNGDDILSGGADAAEIPDRATLESLDFLNVDDGFADQLIGGKGDDTYYAGDQDTITDSDGNGAVFFNGIELKGIEPEDDDHACDDQPEDPNNTADNGSKTGEHGEVYTRSGTGLTVTYEGATLTIEDWEEDELGISLEEDKPEEGTPPDCNRSPLVLDLDGDGIELTALADGDTYFDIDNDGDAERTAWVNSDDGLLAIDLNNNGVIDDAGELFGYGGTFSGAGGADNVPFAEDFGILAGPGGLDITYTSGFDKLAALDFNLDGVIDATDTFYSSLIVWRDLDGDGVSDAGEMFGLAESGIESISTSSVAVDVQIGDSYISDTGSFTDTDGAVGEVSDVWFHFNQFDTQYDDSYVTEEISALPNIQGTGGLPDLHVAMADDPVLTQMVSDLTALGGEDLAGFRAAVQNIMYRWAGVEDINPFDRGMSADGQRVAFIEVVSDTPFLQWSGPDPRSNAGQILDLQFETILRDMMVRFAGQIDLGAEVISEISFNNGAFIDLDPGTNAADMLDTIFDTAPGDWAGSFAHIQAGVMMLDRVYLSFDDVASLDDGGNAYRADVEARLNAAGFADIPYDAIVSATIGTDADDAIITPATAEGFTSSQTDIVLTGAGDDEVKWGNKQEILLWGVGQGNDEIDIDGFFARGHDGELKNTVRLIDLNQSDVTIGLGDGFAANDM